MIRRYAVTALAGFVITLGLFFLMQELIARTGDRELKKDAIRVIEFTRTMKDTETQVSERKLPDRKEPEQPPPPPEIDLRDIPKPTNAAFEGMAINVPNPSLVGAPTLGVPTDGEEIPLVRIEPRYPPRAQSRGIEGWVLIEFSVSETGTVEDPVVVDAEPSSIFNSAALRAVARWKYKPKVENGKAVKRTGLQVVLTFKIADDRRG